MNKMIRQSLKKIYRGQKGITGLETAIILIAFVVVASVFAYTVLSAGLFATQEGQESIHSGLQESQSTMEIKGAVRTLGLGELTGCDIWVNGDTTNIDTFERNETLGEISTDPAGLTVWDDQDRDGSVGDGSDDPTVIAYKVFDEPIDIAATDLITLWVYNHFDDPLDAPLEADEAFDVVLDGDGNVSNGWDSTLTFAADTDIDELTGEYITTDDATGLTSVTAVGIKGKDDFAVGNDLQITIDDIKESVNGNPVLSSCDETWSAEDNDGDVALWGNGSEKREGSSSLQVTITGDGIGNDESIAYYYLPIARNLSNCSTVEFWIKSTNGLTADNFELVLDDNGANDVAILIDEDLTANTWTRVVADITDETDTDIDNIGGILLKAEGLAGSIAADVIYLDNIETQPVLGQVGAMHAYADTAFFTVSNVISGEPIDFTLPDDVNGDGIISSSDGDQLHKLVITYSDPYQQYTDLSYTITKIGKADADYLLEEGELFQIEVDLSYVNNNASRNSAKVDRNNTFRLEVKPQSGATLIVERTMPSVVKAMNEVW